MINEKQYLELCKVCNSVLLAEDSKIERVAIPWLHVIREHPIFLKNYNDIFESKAWITELISKWLRKFRNSATLLRLVIKTSLKKGQLWYESEEFPPNIDFLFVSHLLNASQAGHEEDFYFGKLPNELVSQGHSVLIALINHSDRKGEKLVIKWNKSTVPRVILSGFLEISEEIASRCQLKKESYKLRKLAKAEHSELIRKVLVRASQEALSNDSQTTLRKYKQIGALVAMLKPKAIIVTHEGHAWERVAFAAARLALPDIRCIGYQHSALFRLQNAIRRNLTHNYNPDHILTAGAVGKVQLETSTGISGIPISILGSNRVYIATDNNDGNCQYPFHYNQFKKLSCLVLPEGITSECHLLFEFSLACAQICPEIQFIWRLHPLITFKSLIAQNPKLKNLPKNIVLSQATIGEDISCCSWALYRGTTAIIMAVQAGLRPIYLQVPNEMTIDPLYEIDNWKTKVTTSLEFQNGITMHTDISQSTLINNEDCLKNYCKKFFLPMNIQMFLSSISIPHDNI